MRLNRATYGLTGYGYRLPDFFSAPSRALDRACGISEECEMPARPMLARSFGGVAWRAKATNGAGASRARATWLPLVAQPRKLYELNYSVDARGVLYFSLLFSPPVFSTFFVPVFYAVILCLRRPAKFGKRQNLSFCSGVCLRRKHWL